MYSALADGSRRTILANLATRGELSVGEAAADLSLSPAGITKHVKVLERAGLIRRRLDGRRHVLSIEGDGLILARDWIDRYRALWTDSLRRLADLAAEIERAEPATPGSASHEPTTEGDRP